MLVVIDYGMGNLGSIGNMLKKIGAPAVLSGDPEVIGRADKLILPGVGAFDNGMTSLAGRGLLPVLEQHVRRDRVPILGICLGLQLFTARSEEGRLPGLGWLEQTTVRFRPPADSVLKVPHMGWNTVGVRQAHPLFAGADPEPRYYFVHSYHLAGGDGGTVLGETQYGTTFMSAVVCANIMGVQFHPEKSHHFGMRLLRNFVERC